MKSLLTAALLAIAATTLVPTPATADCNGIVGVDCVEHLGEGRHGSYFRITIPTNPPWNGDMVLINHGFDLDPASITPHRSCSNGKAIVCDVDADCPSGGVCKKITYFGLDEGLLPNGVAVAASTYSTTGWSAFKSRKDLKDMLSFMKRNPAIGKPSRVIITGFSMGGGVTIDASLRIASHKIAGIIPLCPAAAGGGPTWDAAHDLRLIYDFICAGVPGATFFSASDEGDPTDEIGLAIKVDQCLGALGSPTPDQAARMAQFRAFSGHTGSDFEVIVLMGFATQGMYDLVHDRDKLSGRRFGANGRRFGDNQGIVYDVDPLLDAGIERVSTGNGRKKLRRNYLLNYTRGKGKHIDYPIVHLANDADYLTVPPFQRVFQNGLSDAGHAFTSAFIAAGGHCNFTSEEVTATVESFFTWLDGGTQPTDSDIEAACLALPTGDATTCRFDIGFVPPPLSSRVPARADWPAAAK